MLYFSFSGLFLNDTGAISDKFYLSITPAGWTFSIWGVIYVWQVLFLLYGLSTICRRGPHKGYLYYDPGHVPGIVYFLYVSNMALNVSWLFIFDRQQILPALIVIALLPFSLYIMLFFTCKAVVDHGMALIEAGMKKEIWLTRILVHNAFGMYAAWTTIATLLNLAMVLTYYPGVDLAEDVASSISLGILAFELLFYSFIDFFLIDRYVRFLLTPYLVVPVALIGSIAKNWDITQRNSIITAALLAISGMILILKVSLIVWRQTERPVFNKESDRKNNRI